MISSGSNLRLHPSDAINELGEKKVSQLVDLFDLEPARVVSDENVLTECKKSLQLTVVLEKIKEAINQTLTLKRAENFDPKPMAGFFAKELFSVFERFNLMEDEEMDILQGDLEAVFRTLIFTVFHQWNDRYHEGKSLVEAPINFDINIASQYWDTKTKAGKVLQNFRLSGITDNQKLRKFYNRLVVLCGSPLKGGLKNAYANTFRGDPIQFPKGAFTRMDLEHTRKYLTVVFGEEFEEVNW